MGSRPGRRTPLTGILLERIQREGPLTYAAFMEACLYHPEHGYYTARVPGTGQSDYLTSVETGQLFGCLLARQLAEMWEQLERPARFEVVECGAGRGRLAEAILPWVDKHARDFASALHLTLVEISEGMRAQAQRALASYGMRVECAAALPVRGIVGCLLSNELVDALPVHRVVQRREALREIYVGAQDGKLVEVEGELSSQELSRYLERYGKPLEEGQLAEVHPAALAWLEGAAAALKRGFLLTIDYGYPARELYGPAHQRGTFTAYRDHRTSEDWLEEPGRQDLTAHVNFTALEERGRELGLTLLGCPEQAQFLLSLLRASEFRDLPAGGAAAPREQLASRVELQQLIHPEGLGANFKVLIQAKGVEGARLTGLAPP
ncbi:MAG: class I SAM-dependent methyltransferase [Terriglobia bacterium]